jgi:hypothetical protein
LKTSKQGALARCPTDVEEEDAEVVLVQLERRRLSLDDLAKHARSFKLAHPDSGGYDGKLKSLESTCRYEVPLVSVASKMETQISIEEKNQVKLSTRRDRRESQ